MEKIDSKTFSAERALYNSENVALLHCRFEGEEDGESALKESSNVELHSCFFDLRYPLWHDNNVLIDDCEMTPNCRAALWYTNNLNIVNSKLHGIKALRECNAISIRDTEIVSPEFGWKSNDIKINNSSVEGEYAFLMANNMKITDIKFKGKYSFQYVKDVEIHNSVLDTKDAFWHSHNVTVYDSVLKGEYLAWYSDGLTLINCHIVGTQPLCYCKNLKLINCTTEDCDLSFENSDVNASIKGNIVSIKNPLSGVIEVESVGEIIKEESKYPLNATIKVLGK